MSPGHTECWFSDQKGPETTCSESSWCPQGPGRKQGVNSKRCDLKMFKQKDERPERVGGTAGKAELSFSQGRQALTVCQGQFPGRKTPGGKTLKRSQNLGAADKRPQSTCWEGVKGEWRMWDQGQMRGKQERKLSSPKPARIYEKAPHQGIRRDSALSPQHSQEKVNLPSLKEEGTGCDQCATLKSSMNPPRPPSFDYRVDRLRKQSLAPGHDPQH